MGFKELPNRDAWSTIKGFVYQVDHTLKEWLNLGEKEVLELERGEDIDKIANELAQNGISSRELLQVKHRESNLTLNNLDALDLLKNFFLNLRNNPGLKIRYWFVTNTSYSTERPAIFKDGRKGIDVWINLSRKDEINPSDEDYISIKKHLLKKIKSEIPNSENTGPCPWKDFYLYIKKDANLILFIQSFKWNFKEASHTEISENVKKDLQNIYNVEKSKIDYVYSKIFLFVLKLLTNKGVKRLTPLELKDHLAKTEFSDEEKRLLNTILSIQDTISSNFNKLENQVQDYGYQITSLTENVEQLQKDAYFDYHLINLPTSPPLVIKNGTKREEKVQDINSLLQTYNWVNLQGINGTGKSQLARLIVDNWEKHYWIDFQNFKEPEKVEILIISFLAHLTGEDIFNIKNNLLESIKKLPEDSLIVINDFPKIEENKISNFFVPFIQAITHNEIRLITTSNYHIDNSFSQFLDSSTFYEYDDCNFSTLEIEDYLINFGLQSFVKYTPLISALSKNNPRVVTTILNYIKERKLTSKDPKTIELLFKKEFSIELVDDVQLAINKYISDSKSKELLYRLSLIYWNFGRDEILEVSEIEERIDHPYSKLQDLTHLWIQKYPDRRFSNSPLIEEVGKYNLPSATVKSVYKKLAHFFLNKKKINQLYASRIISSFIKADEPTEACLSLLMVYKSAQTTEEALFLEQWGFLSYWKTDDIPDETELAIKASVRLEQIRLFKLLNRETKIYKTFLNDYLLSTNDKSIKTFIHFLLISNPEDTDLNSFFKHSREIIENAHALSEEHNEIFDPKSLSAHLWLKIGDIYSKEDLNTWQELVSRFHKIYGINIFENEFANDAVTLIALNIIKSENNTTSDQDWDNVINRLNDFADFLVISNKEILSSIVKKEIIKISFNELNNPELAEQKTREFLSYFSEDISHYYLKENLGKLYFNQKEIDEGYKWLSDAILHDSITEKNYPSTLLYAASAISQKDAAQALKYSIEAEQIADMNTELTELEVLLVKAELAISYWLIKENLKSFKKFKDVIYRLIEIKEESPSEQWIIEFSWIGHSLGYISQDVSRSTLPTKVSDGSTYIKPYQGIILTNNKSLSDLYKPENDALILMQLAILAEGVGEIYQTYDISLKAFDLARLHGSEEVIQMVSGLSSQYTIVRNKISEALEINLFFSAISAYKNKNDFRSSITLKKLHELKPGDIWNTAEETLITFAILPLFLLNKLNNSLESLILEVENYYEDASNKDLWKDLIDLLKKLSEGDTKESELVNLSNQYGDNNQSYFQNLVILSMTVDTENHQKKFDALINVFPYLFELTKSSKAVRNSIYLPYFSKTIIDLLKSDYVGSESELNQIIQDISSVEYNEPIAGQRMMKKLVENTGFQIPSSRAEWMKE